MKKFNIAIVGITGMVGRSFLQVLSENKFPINKIYGFASSKSAGINIDFNGQKIIVEELTENSFKNKNIDIALFSAGGQISEKYAPIAVKDGAIVIDNSSAWRMHKDVPLVVPEVNPEDIKLNNGIIANPNCSTIQAVVALKPLHDKYTIKRIVYSTYQSVSGAGYEGVKDLENGIKGEAPKKFIYPIAYNCIPHIDIFLDNGYTKEEMKMINETKKILHCDSIGITATTVRVPVSAGHSESINVEFKDSFKLEDIFNILKNSDGIIVEDDVKNNIYPMAINCKGKNDVFIGRLRRDESIENGLNMWVVSDNIRKGAATNAVQIAEKLLQYL